MEAPSARGARWNRGFRLLPRTVRQWAPALLRAAGKHHGLPYECLRRASEGESLFWSGAEAFYESQKAALLTPWVRERPRGGVLPPRRPFPGGSRASASR